MARRDTLKSQVVFWVRMQVQCMHLSLKKKACSCLQFYNFSLQNNFVRVDHTNFGCTITSQFKCIKVSSTGYYDHAWHHQHLSSCFHINFLSAGEQRFLEDGCSRYLIRLMSAINTFFRGRASERANRERRRQSLMNERRTKKPRNNKRNGDFSFFSAA